MPYITKESRAWVDDEIGFLTEVIKTEAETKDDPMAYAGILNYAMTKLCLGVMPKVNYGNIALVTGVLENVKQEFYRRLASPYEDKKANENGDIPQYETR